MDDAGYGIFGILLDALPNAHDVPAGRIHELTTFGFQLAPGGYLRPDGRDDHDVFRLQLIDLVITRLAGDSYNAHAPDLIVHFGIMNDLAQQEDAPLRISLARRVRQVNRSLHAVTKPKFLRQLDGEIAGRKN